MAPSKAGQPGAGALPPAASSAGTALPGGCGACHARLPEGVFCHPGGLRLLPPRSPHRPSSVSPGSHSAFLELPRGRSVSSSPGAPASPEGHPHGSRPRPEGPQDKLVALRILPLLFPAQIEQCRRRPLGRGLARQPGLPAQWGAVRCRRRTPAPAGRRASRAPGCGRGSLGAQSRAAGLRDRLRGHLLRDRPFTLACAHGPRWKAGS